MSTSPGEPGDPVRRGSSGNPVVTVVLPVVLVLALGAAAIVGLMKADPPEATGPAHAVVARGQVRASAAVTREVALLCQHPVSDLTVASVQSDGSGYLEVWSVPGGLTISLRSSSQLVACDTGATYPLPS